MPDIGRFFNIDPLAEDYYYNSPYAFSENKVTSHIELEGLEAISIQADARVAIPISYAGVTGSTSFGVAVGKSNQGSGTYVVPFGTATLGVSGGAGFNVGLSGSVNLTANIEDLGGLGFNTGAFLSANPAGVGPTGALEFNSTAGFDPGGTIGPSSLGFGAGGAVYAEGAYTFFLSEPISLDQLGNSEMVQQIADGLGISVDQVTEFVNGLNNELNTQIENRNAEIQKVLDNPEEFMNQQLLIESDNTRVNTTREF